jgi:hypothetical protein
METKEMLEALCAAYGRKQGAQVKQLVKVEFEKLQKVQSMVEEVLPKGGLKRAKGKVPTLDKTLTQ